MNEQQNTALVQKLYEAFGKGDIATILAKCSPDVDWQMAGPTTIPFAGMRKGLQEVQGFFEALMNNLDGMNLTTEVWVAQGDVVATLGTFNATVKATGKPTDGPVGHFFTIKDGKVTKFVDLGDTAKIAGAFSATSAAAH